MFSVASTVLSPIKILAKLLNTKENNYLKDVLKDDYKNNISFDDDFFRIKNGRKS